MSIDSHLLESQLSLPKEMRLKSLKSLTRSIVLYYSFYRAVVNIVSF